MQRTINAWLDLSANQKAQWTTLANQNRTTDRLGMARQPSGRVFFIQQNLFRLQAGLSILSDATNIFGVSPTIWQFGNPIGPTFDIAGEIFYRTNGVGTGYILYYGGPWYRASYPTTRTPLRFLGSEALSGTLGIQAYELNDEWDAIWPRPTTGQDYVISARILYTQMLVGPPGFKGWTAPIG